MMHYIVKKVRDKINDCPNWWFPGGPSLSGFTPDIFHVERNWLPNKKENKIKQLGWGSCSSQIPRARVISIINCHIWISVNGLNSENNKELNFGDKVTQITSMDRRNGFWTRDAKLQKLNNIMLMKLMSLIKFCSVSHLLPKLIQNYGLDEMESFIYWLKHIRANILI